MWGETYGRTLANYGIRTRMVCVAIAYLKCRAHFRGLAVFRLISGSITIASSCQPNSAITKCASVFICGNRPADVALLEYTEAATQTLLFKTFDQLWGYAGIKGREYFSKRF